MEENKDLIHRERYLDEEEKENENKYNFPSDLEDKVSYLKEKNHEEEIPNVENKNNYHSFLYSQKKKRYIDKLPIKTEKISSKDLEDNIKYLPDNVKREENIVDGKIESEKNYPVIQKNNKYNHLENNEILPPKNITSESKEKRSEKINHGLVDKIRYLPKEEKHGFERKLDDKIVLSQTHSRPKKEYVSSALDKEQQDFDNFKENNINMEIKKKKKEKRYSNEEDTVHYLPEYQKDVGEKKTVPNIKKKSEDYLQKPESFDFNRKAQKNRIEEKRKAKKKRSQFIIKNLNNRDTIFNKDEYLFSLENKHEILSFGGARKLSMLRKKNRKKFIKKNIN